jgi:4-hydroxythreonine-4-phosphate dehydrogenase
MPRSFRDGLPPIALSQGDPSGIGPEITLKAWIRAREKQDVPPFFVVADPDVLAATARSLNLNAPVKLARPAEAASMFAHALPVCPLGHSAAAGPGAPDVRNAAGAISAIETCVKLVQAGEAAAAVTNPIAKELFHRAGFRYPGHTEFLAELAERYWGERAKPVMLIWSPKLAVVPATIHVPLARVPSLLTRELLVSTGLIVAKSLASRFGLNNPRLAFTGLNPHAGEGGTMGREEAEVIAPALAELSAAGVTVSGPHAADTLFRPGARKTYDVVIAMYHDQALIPVKTIAFEKGVNVTLGLPFVRTSPDHGTAFGIAGKGVADPASLIAALQLAGRLARRNSFRAVREQRRG